VGVGVAVGSGDGDGDGDGEGDGGGEMVGGGGTDDRTGVGECEWVIGRDDVAPEDGEVRPDGCPVGDSQDSVPAGEVATLTGTCPGAPDPGVWPGWP
jgi:hypothetical protein